MIKFSSTAELRASTIRELTSIAKKLEITGVSSMRKDDLVDAIRKAQQREKRRQDRTAKSVGTKKKSTKNATATSRTSSKTTKSSAKRGAKSGSKSAGTKKKQAALKAGAKPTTKKKASKKKPARKADTAAKASGPSPFARRAGRPDAASVIGPAAGPKSTSNRRLIDRSEFVAGEMSEMQRELRERTEASERRKDLSASVLVAGSSVKGPKERGPAQEVTKDRLALIVRDSFWLQ
ncbi:MAG: Rho termination factor N-terminal domain-containing protein, partial [Planctomycetota bacterium]